MEPNNELAKHLTLFSDNQGMGYIFDNDYEILQYINPVTVTVGTETLNPGNFTTLDKYLLHEVKYLGIVEDNGMILYYGSSDGLHYYGLIFLLTKHRIFEMFSPRGGRDHNFKNGVWK